MLTCLRADEHQQRPGDEKRDREDVKDRVFEVKVGSPERGRVRCWVCGDVCVGARGLGSGLIFHLRLCCIVMVMVMVWEVDG